MSAPYGFASLGGFIGINGKKAFTHPIVVSIQTILASEAFDIGTQHMPANESGAPTFYRISRWK
ncbi:hypothetical protein [Trinickia sp. Y13]|uniref:hypothetical protein n=1 Tax=Trinickia sp. Y13 TaxID=2917807 RepID=UPI002406292D|nr:hypothetical protein [Trinickia sp. Y13]MDG0026859.1 hypothetical protein [Trinickia sp. Y13]